ncbi:MAG: sigma-54 dependent transcriptional regulator [Verrucomicrobia bacterium]|nr:sigma-54 dependent transcriptional regulator [Verrucomicrobiota bacterium]MDA1085633.1 sigma-54 dependent transcriptional regulator [Verrucomicrobiota bacterium]
MKKARVLIIEDDPDGRRSVVEAVSDAGFEVVAAETGAQGISCFEAQDFDAVLSDLVLPDIEGTQVLERVQKLRPGTPFVIMTAHGSIPTAVHALKSGAHDYILKPLDLEGLQSKIARAVETGRLRKEVRSLKDAVSHRYSARSMIAGAASMKDVLNRIENVASTDATVLVLGESGTGKELVARALHADGTRVTGPFVAVNCGAIAESLLEAELFGHEKGSFTGAHETRKGAFERADGGTLFLDEVGIAPLSVQARLLRVLEEREVTRVGGQGARHVDVRVVAASNRDLHELVQAGDFRHDLLYRLEVVTIELPPLRERREDIRPLIERFVAVACESHSRHIDKVANEFVELLEQYDWPGNIRELRNAVESAVIMTPSSSLDASDVKFGRRPDAGRDEVQEDVPASLAAIEKQAILRALQRHDGNRTLAAAELDVSVRTVQRKIKDYELPF